MARHHLTSVIQFSARAGALAAMLIGAAPHAFAACQSPAAFGGWLQGFKKSAVAQGISPGVVSEALDGLTYDPATIAKDRSQGVFAQSFLQFAGRMVSGNRLERRLLAAQEERVDLRRDSAEIWRTGPRAGRLLGTWRPISAR